MEKYLYCPTCKTYPETVIEKSISDIVRVWDGDCYEEMERNESEEEVYHCPKCQSVLEQR